MNFIFSIPRSNNYSILFAHLYISCFTCISSGYLGQCDKTWFFIDTHNLTIPKYYFFNAMQISNYFFSSISLYHIYLGIRFTINICTWLNLFYFYVTKSTTNIFLLIWAMHLLSFSLLFFNQYCLCWYIEINSTSFFYYRLDIILI